MKLNSFELIRFQISQFEIENNHHLNNYNFFIVSASNFTWNQSFMVSKLNRLKLYNWKLKALIITHSQSKNGENIIIWDWILIN